MSSAFIRSTIEVRHSSFSCLAAAAVSTSAATSTLWGGAAGVDVLGAAPLGAGAAAVPPDIGAASAGATPPLCAALVPAPLPVGVALAEWPKIALMIFPKTLIHWLLKDLE